LAPTDYASIEARVLLWLAGATAALKIFESGGDIYCDLASDIYRRTITKADEKERQLGKQGILGLGFGMGAPKFLVTLRKYGISFTEEECRKIVGPDYSRLLEEWLAPPSEPGQEPKWARAESVGLTRWDLPELVVCSYVVERYRNRYPEVVAFWARMEECAIEAARSNRLEVQVNDKIAFKRIGRFLMMRLPSGRTIKYYEPRVKMKKTPWGEWREALHYMGLDSKTKQWIEKSTYSGMLTENGVQGCARDFLADVIVRIELDRELGPDVDIVAHVHDEGIPTVPMSWTSAERVEQSFQRKPAWGVGCPIGAEGRLLERYSK
jgi:DNA polymerase